jgi:hypothetical protein
MEIHNPLRYKLAQANVLYTTGTVRMQHLDLLELRQRVLDALTKPQEKLDAVTPIIAKAGLQLPPDLANPKLADLIIDIRKSAETALSTAVDLLADVVDRSDDAPERKAEAQAVLASAQFALYRLTKDTARLANAKDTVNRLATNAERPFPMPQGAAEFGLPLPTVTVTSGAAGTQPSGAGTTGTGATGTQPSGPSGTGATTPTTPAGDWTKAPKGWGSVIKQLTPQGGGQQPPPDGAQPRPNGAQPPPQP